MWTGTTAGRRERLRIAARVRELLAGDARHGEGSARNDLSGASGEPAGRSSVGPFAARISDRPGGRSRWRLDPGRGGAAAVGAAVLVAAAGTGAWVLAARPRSIPVLGTSSAAPGPAANIAPGTAAAGGRPVGADPLLPSSSGSKGSTRATVLVVDVAGRVRRPGLYSLAPGSRVDDAVRAAGGALPGVSLITLNLASTVNDGEQIVVGLPGSMGATGAGFGGGSPGGGTGVVNLNSASLAQLDALPGVGPVLAQRILDWHNAHGGFSSVGQLNEVSGIGDARFADLRARVSV